MNSLKNPVFFMQHPPVMIRGRVVAVCDRQARAVIAVCDRQARAAVACGRAGALDHTDISPRSGCPIFCFTSSLLYPQLKR